MIKDKQLSSEKKNNIHPRNKHRFRYNFPELIANCPELSKYVALNSFNDLSVDFKNPQAVKALNQALLKVFYAIKHWDIPEGYLCPPIPGRADYIHYMADLLADSNHQHIPTGKSIKVLDIGVGANCVYPLIGHKEYGWSFVGSEIDNKAIKSAKSILEANSLSNVITVRKQISAEQIFKGLIKPGEVFDLTICNPPFHGSLQEATLGTVRKWKNLGKTKEPTLNFGGRNSELWCEGGESEFIRKMILESAQLSKSSCWFTSLVSKKDTLRPSYKALEKVKAVEIKTINMGQGQKISRVLAWTFLSKEEQLSRFVNK